MYYLILIIVGLMPFGPRAGYPVVLQEVKIPAAHDSTQIIYLEQYQYQPPPPPPVVTRPVRRWPAYKRIDD